jgi:hypothetical protein
MSKNWTRSYVETTLKEIVAEYGADYHPAKQSDGRIFTSEGCYYFKDGAACCGVGVLFERSGVTEAELLALPGARPINITPLSSLFREGKLELLGISVEPGALGVLCEFQNSQDEGKVWGRSLSIALDEEDDPLDGDED